jgi:uncharacterized protein (TIGR04255 family)
MEERDYTEIFKQNFLRSVSCEVRFKADLLIKDKIPQIQHEIKEILPNIGVGGSFNIPGIASSPLSEYEWDFRSMDNIKTLKISPNNISFIVNQYDHFKPFFEEALKYFRLFFKKCDINEVLRIGLRYVNEISFDVLENIENIPLTEYFNIMLENSIFIDYKPREFNLILRSQKNKYDLVVKNLLKKNPDGTKDYVIDIDSFYLNDKIKISDLDDIIKTLHNLLIIEFHRNVTPKFIDLLKRED